MKKGIALLLAVVMLLSLAACGKNDVSEKPGTGTTSGREYDTSDPAAVLAEITNDFDATTKSLTQKLEETFTSVGTTYEDYQKNKGLIDAWVELVLSEADALFARTKENSIAYFNLIAADPDHKYSEFCDEALDEYYDMVYDDAMDEFYEALYDDAMDDLYDQYYDGIVSDAYDDLEYNEWSKASSECYKTWSAAHSEIYKKWSEEHSYIYGLWSAINSAFCWNDNYDVDAIVAEYEQKKVAEDTEETQESTEGSTATEAPTESTAANTTDDIDPDFKAAMDSYEKLFDEYVAIMKKYKDKPTDMSILTDYATYMGQYADMMQKLEKWESEDLNAAEAAYYVDVMARISKKLLEVT